jgi:hypothetical protein
MLVEVCEKLARQAVIRSGGKIINFSSGPPEELHHQDIFFIPIKQPKPGRLEQCWNPGPVAGSKFTKQEMNLIKAPEKEN